VLVVADSSQPAARPWYRLHLSTSLLLIPAIAVVLLLEIPGDEPAGLIFDGSEMVHGFPFTYLRRCRDDWISASPSWPRLARSSNADDAGESCISSRFWS
jgi:hypothetical protein